MDSSQAGGGSVKKRAARIAVDLMIALVAGEALYYAYRINTDRNVQVVTGIVAVTAVSVCLWKALRSKERLNRRTLKRAGKKEGITKLVLLDEEGERIKEWLLQGETSLLIGKSSSQREVEVDLADTEYASLVSSQHAVLNYADGGWFIEDLESRNGVGIRQSGRGSAVRLEQEVPFSIGVGDMIYIANTRLLLK
ncbi:FHA domain-containing protein [Paenibacillus sp. MMS18-CY102]|uniref:FHA domain-containing protein n=1 Tax=Paenibacillus sp. MMS18-CY102 TaxID=2682849 RepID=UPI001F20F8ED|nr:FHA domain-containing protein [Paenibacillus sp. MMS18-CY102]